MPQKENDSGIYELCLHHLHGAKHAIRVSEALTANFAPRSAEYQHLVASLNLLYGQELYKYLRILLRNKDGVQDLSQEVWLKIHRKLHQYRGDQEEKFLCWARMVALNCLRGDIRKTSRCNSHFKSQPGPKNEVLTFPVGLYKSIHQAQVLGQLMAFLGPEDQEFVKAYHLEEVPCAEMGKRLNVVPTTVRVKASRIRERLLALAIEHNIRY